MYTLYAHQQRAADFILANNRVLDFSDCGTGKTLTQLHVIAEEFKQDRGKTLILAPKSILMPAWGSDIEKFTPHLRYVVATAQNREKAFKTDADIYITNHDAATWLAARPKLLQGFYRLVIDESTAFKNPSSQRSKAMNKIVRYFTARTALTGTPTPNTVTDVWQQARLVDDGERLGTRFYPFRGKVQSPANFGWVDKPNAEATVTKALEDITIRNSADECLDLPENRIIEIPIEMNKKHAAAYEQLLKTARLMFEGQEVRSLNAATLAGKLLQAAAGVVYDDDREPMVLDTSRAELVTELVAQERQAVVAFNWEHQRAQLTKLAKKAGFEFGIIAGDVSQARRDDLVRDFQAGNLKALYMHPASASHGLTLTRGTATIWTSPVNNLEYFAQFNKRVHRNGVKHKTRTILIYATGTKEIDAYRSLMRKGTKMKDFLQLVLQEQRIGEAA